MAPLLHFMGRIIPMLLLLPVKEETKRLTFKHPPEALHLRNPEVIPIQVTQPHLHNIMAAPARQYKVTRI